MPSPIEAIDHLHIAVADLNAAAADYEILLGCSPSWTGSVNDRAGAVFETPNLAVFLDETGDDTGLCGVCFRVDSIERLRRRARNLGMAIQPVGAADPLAALFDAPPEPQLDIMEPGSARGLQLSFVERPDARPFNAAGATLGLDHVVIASADGDGTALLLGAQLGLDMRMDMSRPDWNARLMFFRCGDLIVEVFQQLKDNDQAEHDSFYGLSWRVPHAAQTQQRLADSGFDVSEVRKGRKPGTEVLTVRDRTSGVATLLLQPPGS